MLIFAEFKFYYPLIVLKISTRLTDSRLLIFINISLTWEFIITIVSTESIPNSTLVHKKVYEIFNEI